MFYWVSVSYNKLNFRQHQFKSHKLDPVISEGIGCSLRVENWPIEYIRDV